MAIHLWTPIIKNTLIDPIFKAGRQQLFSFTKSERLAPLTDLMNADITTITEHHLVCIFTLRLKKRKIPLFTKIQEYLLASYIKLMTFHSYNALTNTTISHAQNVLNKCKFNNITISFM